MFPIGDHNPSGRTPYVTLALIALNAVVFLATFTAMGDWQLTRFFMTWGMVPARLGAGQGCDPDHPRVPAWRLDAHHRQHAVSVDLR